MVTACHESDPHLGHGRYRERNAVIRRRPLRRTVAALLVVAGGALLLLAPSAGPGLVAFALGVLIEAVGLALERRDRSAR
jgi:hypothetical protein